jgi:hypothetical protein
LLDVIWCPFQILQNVLDGHRGKDFERCFLDEYFETRQLMVTGDSGSGKSSLVRAGLVPGWRGGAIAELQGRRPDEEIWHVVETRPRGNPRRELGVAANEAAKRVGISLSDRGTLQDWAVSGDIEKVRRALRCPGTPLHLAEQLVAHCIRAFPAVNSFDAHQSCPPRVE